MPIRGGTSDKLGNHYEFLWACDQLLRIVEGRLIDLTLEPISREESLGVEFAVTKMNGTMEYWSVKRQTTQAGWTLALLTSKDKRGRSIFGDLLGHVRRSPRNFGVFASTLGAGDLQELCRYGVDEALFNHRLELSTSLQAKFRKYILPLCDGNTEFALQILKRIRSHAADEAQLRDRVEGMIRKLFFDTSGAQLNVGGVLGILGELLITNLHTPIERPLLLATLQARNIRLRDWAIDKTVQMQLHQLCDSYITPIKAELINGAFLPLAGFESILAEDGMPNGSKMLIVGGAGGGKSTALGHLVELLQRSNIPVLAIRFDQLPEGILVTRDLGRKLSLPDSPAFVLAAVAADAPSVLVIDQLDAISMTSGRRVELWSLFDSLRREVEQFPKMSLIVGCREFDLEHDQRMRTMKYAQSGFSLITLRPLSLKEVDVILQKAKLNISSINWEIKTVLSLPLHMSMFLHLTPASQGALHDREGLFDSFWAEVERRANRRAERTISWIPIIDRLTEWLSSHQRLSAPRYLLDDFAADADILTSERVLILSDGQYRFFHEAFFDYAFARRFAAHGKELVSFLLGGEQDLFRRAQVRQILSYARSHDRTYYLRVLRNLLLNDGVRFHIKCLVLQWISSLQEPTVAEWRILREVREALPSLNSHIRGAVMGNASWFGVLDAAHYFDEIFSSCDVERKDEIIGCFSSPTILKQRSPRITQLLNACRDDKQRIGYIQTICSSGEFYHDRGLFDLFLDLVRKGIVGAVDSDNGGRGGWWHLLYSVSKERPEWGSELIGAWLEAAFLSWSRTAAGLEKEPLRRMACRSFADQISNGGDGTTIIRDASQAYLAYATSLLPPVAEIVRMTAKQVDGYLDSDPLWTFRSYGDDGLRNDDVLFSSLGRALERLSFESPEKLDSILAPYSERPHSSIAYLVLRAWSANPTRYAERIADFLSEDPRRLKIGYAMSGGAGGTTESYMSMKALKACSARCSTKAYSGLEEAILTLQDRWESHHPSLRGLKKLKLLRCLDRDRLSKRGKTKLAELERKFPIIDDRPPVSIGSQTGLIGAPISEEAQSKMSDAQWLRAMRKYRGRNFRGGVTFAGGELELAGSLEQRTSEFPTRFAGLAKLMPNDLPPSYFESILRGIARRGQQDPSFRDSELATALIRRVHSIPSRPCGRWIAWLVHSWGDITWSDEVIDTVAWYAVNDPDPNNDAWKMQPDGEAPSSGEDAFTIGMNSARGASAQAIATILDANPSSFQRLEEAVHAVTHDRIISVRAVGIQVLLGLLNINAGKAILWFKEACDESLELLNTPIFERFIYYGGSHDYEEIRPIILLMMSSPVRAVAVAGARQACILGLNSEAAEEDARRACLGPGPCREGAAGVYARNAAHKEVGQFCLARLKEFFFDEVDAVRLKAASTFQILSELNTSDQADLFQSFLESKPKIGELWLVLHFLQNSPVQLPDIMLRLITRCVVGESPNAGENLNFGASMEASKILVRLLIQTEDAEMRSRCLDLIDMLEQNHFIGLSTELYRIDR